jgi:hypothetical protein
LFQLARVLVRFDHVARVIKNLNDSIKAEATDLPGNQKRFWRDPVKAESVSFRVPMNSWRRLGSEN